jgi:hypothetical protein
MRKFPLCYGAAFLVLLFAVVFWVNIGTPAKASSKLSPHFEGI